MGYRRATAGQYHVPSLYRARGPQPTPRKPPFVPLRRRRLPRYCRQVSSPRGLQGRFGAVDATQRRISGVPSHPGPGAGPERAPGPAEGGL